MTKTFNYNGEVLWSDSITLESLGNVSLEARDSFDRNYYLIARTSIGETTVLEFGPVYPEEEVLPPNYSIFYDKFECSDNAMIKRITKFLGPKKGIGKKKVPIVSVKEISFDEAVTYGINPFKYVKDYYNGE